MSAEALPKPALTDRQLQQVGHYWRAKIAAAWGRVDLCRQAAAAPKASAADIASARRLEALCAAEAADIEHEALTGKAAA